MLRMNKKDLADKKFWGKMNIGLPEFNYSQMLKNTRKSPTWVHFGAGNIFRGYISVLQQTLLDMEKVNSGIVAVETFDFEIIDRIYKPYDNLSLLVIMNKDGSLDKKIVGSVSEALVGDISRGYDWGRLTELFSKPSLQIASFTITEKGYNLKKMIGEYFEDVERDMCDGLTNPRHAMTKIAALLYNRFKNGQYPIAMVSMDNCSHNGEKLQQSVETIVKEWVENKLVEKEYLEYVQNPKKVSFPWTMIDKITPRPSEYVQKILINDGFDKPEIICTGKSTYVAPFVNAEAPQYLVVEDDFPNGRMPLECAGVIFTDRETVNNVEKMKVCTCLNPLHTTLAVFGCLLGYTLIADEMKDSELKKLVERIGYIEGLPVVVNPKIINPENFIREVLEERLPNPFIPDTPQRIATDTSQKIGIRFGETIKAYQKREDLKVEDLKYIPLVIAGWCRYLLGWDDAGNKMEISPDPMIKTLKPFLAGIILGEPESFKDHLKPILSNESLFGSNLYEVGLGDKIEDYFKEMITGKNAVRMTLQKYL